MYISLLSAIVGAFIGAVAAGAISHVEKWRSRRRERKALLLLIDAELFEHINLFEGALEARQELEEVGYSNTMHDLPPLTTSDWEIAKHHLGQLLPSDHMEALIIYYIAVSKMAR